MSPSISTTTTPDAARDVKPESVERVHDRRSLGISQPRMERGIVKILGPA